MTNNTFVEGMYFNKPHENAPDWIVGKLAFDQRFIEFYNKNKDAEGKLYAEVCLSNMEKKPYVKLDDYRMNKQQATQKPQPQEPRLEAKEVSGEFDYPEEQIDPSSIPF